LGIFIRPVETVREARKLVDSALALDPDCANARLQLFSLDCISLNFKQAFQHPVTPNSDISDYLLLVKAFPEFEYSEESRPSTGQMMNFLQHARRINPNRRALMERVIAYDHAARPDSDDYVPVVEALLQYINDRSGQPVLRYNAEELLLTLYSKESLRLYIWDEWGSQECLLRFLSFRSFSPVVGGRFYVGDLHNLQIEMLDLRDCEEVVINAPLDLPLLRTLYVRPGQLDVEKLRSVIRSNEHFEVVEE
jgi:hypothetical protein